jgi:hypothetical protein
MDPKFQIAFKIDRDFAETCIKRAGELAPMFVVHCRDGSIVPMIVTGFGDNRDGAYQMATVACIAYDAVAISMIAESWMAREDKHDPSGLSPGQRENKREVVAVSFAARDTKLMSIREILRAADGTISGLGDELVTAASHTEGRLYSVLPAVRPTKAQIRTAREMLDACGDRVALGRV